MGGASANHEIEALQRGDAALATSADSMKAEATSTSVDENASDENSASSNGPAAASKNAQKADILAAWSALNAAVYASAERALLQGVENGTDPMDSEVTSSGGAAATAESSIATRGKRSIAANSTKGGTAGGALDRPQRKRNAEGSKASTNVQPAYVSCLPGAPFERPLLLSPVSDLPDRLAAVSFCPAVSDWKEMVGDDATRAQKDSGGGEEKSRGPPVGTVKANVLANDASKQGGMAASQMAAWEEKRILKYRMQADITQLKAVLKSLKEVVKDGNRQLNDAATAERNQSVLLQEVSTEYAFLARKARKLQDEYDVRAKASKVLSFSHEQL
jgi:hypothetical protein